MELQVRLHHSPSHEARTVNIARCGRDAVDIAAHQAATSTKPGSIRQEKQTLLFSKVRRLLSPAIHAITCGGGTSAQNISHAHHPKSSIASPYRTAHETMVLRIRLSRFGKKHAPFYNIVLTHARTARNSRPLEVLGTYNPIPQPPRPGDTHGRPWKDIKLDVSRARYWVGVGAQPSDTAWRLLSMVGWISLGTRGMGARRVGQFSSKLVRESQGCRATSSGAQLHGHGTDQFHRLASSNRSIASRRSRDKSSRQTQRPSR